jgi:hypothetical protein
VDPQINPFSVLTWIVAPALLTNACTLLILSTANRLARAVDRAQELSSEVEKGADATSADAIRRRRELIVHQQRSLMLVAALRSYYVGCGSFATATLISIFGSVVASLGARDVVRVLEVCGAAAGLIAVGALIYGSVVVMRETGVVVRVLQQRAAEMA